MDNNINIKDIWESDIWENFVINTGEIWLEEKRDWNFNKNEQLREMIDDLEGSISFLLKSNDKYSSVYDEFNEEVEKILDDIDKLRLDSIDGGSPFTKGSYISENPNNPRPFFNVITEENQEEMSEKLIDSLINKSYVPRYKIFLFDEDFIVERANIPNTFFLILFAFKIRQTDIEYLYDFLVFHLLTNFNGNLPQYISFLKTVIHKYKNPLFDSGKVAIIYDWIANPQKVIHPVMDFPNSEENPMIEIPDNYTEIEGELSDEEIAYFFSFLYDENIDSGNIFLSKEDTLELLKYGFSIPDIPSGKYFTLMLESKGRSKNVILYCMFELFTAHCINPTGKHDYAKFLKYNFENFKEQTEFNIRSNMKAKKPASMKFDVKDYLPKRLN